MLPILASRFLKMTPLFLLLFAAGCSNEADSVNDGSVADNRAKTTAVVAGSGLDSSGFKLLDAEPVDLLADERLQVINYWATWCLPCLEEMPELATFREEHKEAVEVYAVNYDRLDTDQLRKEILALGVEIPALIKDPNERLGYERPSVLPTTVVMLKGEIKEVLVGPQTKESLEAVLDKWGA